MAKKQTFDEFRINNTKIKLDVKFLDKPNETGEAIDYIKIKFKPSNEFEIEQVPLARNKLCKFLKRHLEHEGFNALVVIEDNKKGIPQLIIQPSRASSESRPANPLHEIQAILQEMQQISLERPLRFAPQSLAEIIDTLKERHPGAIPEREISEKQRCHAQLNTLSLTQLKIKLATSMIDTKFKIRHQKESIPVLVNSAIQHALASCGYNPEDVHGDDVINCTTTDLRKFIRAGLKHGVDKIDYDFECVEKPTESKTVNLFIDETMQHFTQAQLSAKRKPNSYASKIRHEPKSGWLASL